MMPALLLTHGAGSNRNAPLLVALDRAFSEKGWLVERYDLPYRQQRPSGPPHPSKALADREGLASQLARLRSRTSGPVYLGGHSYGGRQSSILASENSSCATALLLLSYPLHPPDRPDQLRTAHFPALQAPAFFVQGEKDPFATGDEIRTALQLIPAQTELLLLPRAGHSLVPKEAPALVDAFCRFINGL